jgi:hypothetical protein
LTFQAQWVGKKHFFAFRRKHARRIDFATDLGFRYFQRFYILELESLEAHEFPIASFLQEYDDCVVRQTNLVITPSHRKIFEADIDVQTSDMQSAHTEAASCSPNVRSIMSVFHFLLIFYNFF